jgi:hypothetical protein
MCSLHVLLCSEVPIEGVSTEEVYLTLLLDSRNTDGHTTIMDKIVVMTRVTYRTVEEMVRTCVVTLSLPLRLKLSHS